LQHQCDPELGQDIREITVEPVLVPKLNRKLLVLGQLLKERHESLKKRLPVAEHPAVEIRQLENDWTKLLLQDAHRVQKFLPFRLTIDEHFVVGDRLRDLHRKDEIVQRLREPTANGLGGRAGIEIRVHFN
jgi:hypothetical protein